MTWDQDMLPSAQHGVTTAIMGTCGVGFAPVHDADPERLIRLMDAVVRVHHRRAGRLSHQVG